jgi:hypothetical protein
LYDRQGVFGRFFVPFLRGNHLVSDVCLSEKSRVFAITIREKDHDGIFRQPVCRHPNPVWAPQNARTAIFQKNSPLFVQFSPSLHPLYGIDKNQAPYVSNLLTLHRQPTPTLNPKP